MRLVLEHRAEHPSEWAAICSIAAKLGITPRRCGTGCGGTRSITACGRADQRRARAGQELEREVRELRRANEILKAASVFFAAELDRRPQQ